MASGVLNEVDATHLFCRSEYSVSISALAFYNISRQSHAANLSKLSVTSGASPEEAPAE
jgi:hypothetical protein